MKLAKLFKNGQSQAVRLPKEFRFEGDSVFIKKVGDSVMLIPKRGYWDLVKQTLGTVTTDFMTVRKQGKQNDREDLFS